MAEEYEPSPILPIGNKKYFCVEYPGYVKRTKRAIQTLGGEKALSEALATDSSVELKFRHGDIFSHPIHGQILPTSKLLVKITRRVKKNVMTGEVIEEPESKWRTEIKGTIDNSLRFRALADFQYLLPQDDKISQLKNALVAGNVEHIMKYKIATDDDNVDIIRNIPPPLFTPVEGSLNYGYRQNRPVLRVRVRQPDGSFIIKLLNRSRRTGFEITSIRFHEENVPTKSWHNIPFIIKPEEDEARIEVAKLFEERPTWSRFALKSRLSPVHHKYLKTALIHNGYTFVDGPWRDCWVKYGIDPRKDPKFHLYQQVDVRRFFSLGPRPSIAKLRSQVNRRQVIEAVKKKASEKASEKAPCAVEENKHIFDGKNIPGASSLYQLCDIIDPDISPIIHNPEYMKSEPSKYCGFYYQCVIERIRKTLRKKHISLVETGKSDSMSNIEDGLMADVEKEKESQKEVEGYEGIEGEYDDNATAADNEDAVREAMKKMSQPDTNRRLKEVVDEYMDELVKDKLNGANEFDGDEDVDLDALEEYDEEFDGFDEEEEGESDIVKNEQIDIPDEEDVAMEEP